MSNFLIKSTMIIVAVTMVGRLLGFFRNIFITNEFGPGLETDAYFMAFTIPFTLFLVVPGAVNAVLIPTMKGLLGEEQSKRRNELFQKTLTSASLLFALLSIAGMIWAEETVALLAGGFAPEKQQLTVELLQIMMPSVFFIGIIAVLSSILNSHHEFFAPSLGTVINSVLVIVSIYLLVPIWGVHGIAWGTTFGFAAFALYLISPVIKRKYSLKWSSPFSTKDTLLRGMGERFVPIMFGAVISQLYLLLERFLVAGLGDQKLTALVLANSIVQLPIAIFAGALAVPLFPLLSEYVKKNQMSSMKAIMGKGLLYQYHVLLPATIGLILLAEEIVRLFYAHSAAFTDQDVALTSWAMIFYSIGMVGWAGRDMLTRAFYAVDNTKTPVIVGGVSLVAYIVFAWIFIPIFNHGGIAFAFSLASFFHLFLQAFLLRRQIGALFSNGFYISLVKGIVAGLAMSGCVVLLKDLTEAWKWLQVPFIALIAGIVYFGLLILFKEQLIKELGQKFAARFRPSKSP
jgi:putative peptidoglycan lipid II flippase